MNKSLSYIKFFLQFFFAGLTGARQQSINQGKETPSGIGSRLNVPTKQTN